MFRITETSNDDLIKTEFKDLLYTKNRYITFWFRGFCLVSFNVFVTLVSGKVTAVRKKKKKNQDY